MNPISRIKPIGQWWFVGTLLLLLASCARMPGIEKAPVASRTFGELKNYLSTQRPELDVFKLYGPFEVVRYNDYSIQHASTKALNVIKADLFFAAHGERAPLLIIVHGYGASREMHEYQARHAATWGLHVATVQVPNQGPWVDNGRMLRDIVNAIAAGRVLADPRVDTSRILLAGHSFGASSVAVALAEGASALGGILLDPATTERAVPVFLGKNKMPLMILGADEQTTATTNRTYFFKYARSRVYEVSIKDAVHEDAQFPAGNAETTEALQVTFSGALTAAALSLGTTGALDYAWASFEQGLKSGKLLRPKIK